MRRTGSQNTRGFTVMELVIVIAIIGVLVAVSMPFAGAWIDQSRRSHDIACVESAVAAAKAEFAYDYDGTDETVHIYTFNAATGEATPARTTGGYGQWDQKADYEVAGKAVGGVAKGSFVTCGIKAGEVTILHWGEHYTWESVVPDLGTTTNSSSGGWAGNKELRSEVLAIDNEERIQVDQQIIKAFSEYFIGKTTDELRTILGNKYTNAVGKNGGMMLDYRIDNNSNSINLIYPIPDTGYLAAIGFPTTQANGQPIMDQQNNYLSSYLFVSDDMIEVNKQRRVNIKITLDANNVCTACRIWVKDVDYLDTDLIDG